LTYDLSETLERAVADAIGVAMRSSSPEPVVLLSPAAASFDQFRNFAERGDTFRNLVKEHKAKGGKAAG
jgi:UDP-N-acetylmuramoylalanine--D-glutamate ligase